MDDLFGIDAHWLWLALGLVLGTLELVVPGVYLIWLAAAAIVTGLLTFAFDPGIPLQVVNFVSLSLIFAYSAKRFLRERPIVSADPLLNNRLGRMIGETAVVTVALDGGAGRVHYGDSDWIARGPDMAVGSRVKIVGAQGGDLLVEPLTLLGDESSGGNPAT